MARSWLVTGRGVAKKIRNATHCANRQINELGAEAWRECPNCKHLIDNSDVAIQWPGLPAGVKFDPSDLELINHLEEKIGLGGSKPHMFIDEFIPTVENVEGICYSHPENLPGTRNDGTSVHFFHRVSNAYGSGHRKRRRITKTDHAVSGENVRWHKTGKSKPVHDNGVMKGWKKILVLYKSSQGGGKPERTGWVMHQYHLGEEEEENEGGLVVSKIFYQMQTNRVEKSKTENADEEFDAFAESIGPKTPKTNTPQPCRPKDSPSETVQDQEGEPIIPIISIKDDAENPAWLAGVSQAVEAAPQAWVNLAESLHCNEVLDSFDNDTSLPFDFPILSQSRIEMLDKDMNVHYGLPDLLNVTPPDLQLADLKFGSQESISNWLDCI